MRYRGSQRSLRHGPSYKLLASLRPSRVVCNDVSASGHEWEVIGSAVPSAPAFQGIHGQVISRQPGPAIPFATVTHATYDRVYGRLSVPALE